MKYPLSIRSLKTLYVFIVLSLVATFSVAQTSHPEGLYKLTEVVHQDGKRMEAGYKQYRYCQDGSSLVFTYSPNVLERAFTFSVSKADDKGVQVIDTSDSTFTYRWYNERDSSNEHLFPYQTTIDEEYIRVKDSADAIRRALDLLQMRPQTKKHRLQGVWKQRGRQQANCATSQYWIEQARMPVYLLFGSDDALMVFAHPGFPSARLQCQYTPCSYLSENVFDCEGRTSLLHWFDGETFSLTMIDENGHPSVTVWDRCGLPQHIQDVFGTDVPQMKKDISRYLTDGFVRQYGNQPDSIRRAFETFDYAVETNERNNAVFPVLMKNGFEHEYNTMKESLLARLMKGEINADEAVGRYVYWFYKDFDRHTSCSSETFYRLRSEARVDYGKLIPQDAPEPVGCKVDDDTYLLRLPSSMGKVPTWEWTQKKAEEFRQSGCRYLILDLRGNTGGSDAFGSMFAKMMCDCGALNDEVSFYRNSTANNNALKKLCRTFPGTHMDRVLAETASAEEGSLINWQTILKGADNFSPLVRKGAIIIDNNSASAGESPVRFIRNHSKSHAKVYGRDRTMGCEQSGNCNDILLPHSNIYLTYPMTVDDTFEKTCKERNPGYSPDVIIPLPYPEQLTGNIDSWVLWVAKKMKK